MRICIIGAGRMGRILAERMAAVHEVALYDRDCAGARVAASSLGLRAMDSLAELDAEAAVLAVPDAAVEACIKDLRGTGKTLPLFSVATNISREMLASFAAPQQNCLNVKIIGHAGEMSRGAHPVLVADDVSQQLTALACKIFAPVGEVVIGQADIVRQINRLATEEALKTGVVLEKALRRAGFEDARMIHAALSLVAAGVLKAYADDDLGPFAREIVSALRDKSDGE